MVQSCGHASDCFVASHGGAEVASPLSTSCCVMLGICPSLDVKTKYSRKGSLRQLILRHIFFELLDVSL